MGHAMTTRSHGNHTESDHLFTVFIIWLTTGQTCTRAVCLKGEKRDREGVKNKLRQSHVYMHV